MPTQATTRTSCPINFGAADGPSIRQQRGSQAILACSSSSHHFSTSMKVSVAALTILIAAFCYQTSAAPRKSRLSPSFRSGNKRDVAAGTELPLRVPPSVPPSSVGSDPPTSCCFSYISRQLPRSFVKDYYETNSQCSQPAVVFITRKGREVCANPVEDWVQQYVNELELN